MFIKNISPMITNYIVSFLKTHRKTLFFITFFLGILALSGDGVFAADPEPAVSQEDFDKIVSALNKVIVAIATLMGMITSFISMFLYPGWVNGTLFGLQEYLKDIWILISNIVYFIFAFLLIAIAFMNIIGKGEGTWELKQAMPKFIVGVLIVPFSWFLVQFILSVSAILTVGVLTLPYDSFSSKELYESGLESLDNEKICKDLVISFSDTPPDGTTAISGPEGEALSENLRCKDEGGSVTVREIFEGTGGGEGIKNSVFGVISVYTYGILSIQNMDTVTGTDLETVKTIADLVFKIVFDLLFIIVYFLLMVALLLALFVRGVRLWIFMMLSPCFGLLYFFGKTDGGSKFEKFSVKEFIALALVPVYVSAALAFGMVFILVASEGIKQEVSSGDEDTLEIGGFSLTVIGAHGNGESERSVIGKLIVEIFGVVILWIAVMAALGASKTTEAIVKPIADFGESVGKLAAAAPTYAPIIPASMGGSAAGLQSLGSGLAGGIDSHFKGEGSKRGAEFAESLTGNGGTAASALRTVVNDNRTGLSSSDPGSIDRVLAGMREQGNRDSLANSNTRREFVTALAEVMGKNASGENILDTTEQQRISRASGDNFVQELRDAISANAGELQGNARQRLQAFLGVSPNAVKREDVDKAFSLGLLAGSTEPEETTPPAGPVTNNITIGTETFANAEAAGASLASNASLTTGTQVREHLRTAGLDDTDPDDKVVVDAVVAAYETAKADSGTT